MNTSTIPNELRIMINTSIPGFQKILYKPSMSVKGVSKDSKSVYFNPLIELNQSVINKIPENVRIKEFFNKGLFQSLINYTNKTPAPNLTQATRWGYVDNNIRTTINSIFPPNSVIYIDNKAYVIVDTQWTTGDWKIDLKINRGEIDINKIKDPYLYNVIVNQNIQTGRQQLATLPQSLIYGPNFVGSKNNQPTLPNTQQQQPLGLTPALPLVYATPIPLALPAPPQAPPPALPALPPALPALTALPPALPALPALPPALPAPPQALPPAPLSLPSALPSPPNISPSPRVEELEDTNEEVDEEEKKSTIIQPISYLPSKPSTNVLQSYFSSANYYYMLNTLFQNMNDTNKDYIKKQLVKTTGKNINEKSKNLSQIAYDESVSQMGVVKSVSDGNCFFNAVSDGININNYTNPSNRVIYNNYGATQPFTINFLRSLVLKYILEKIPKEDLNQMLINSQINADVLNASFTKSLSNKGISDQDYLKLLDSTYINSDNFLVYKPSNVPKDINTYREPFASIKEIKQIKDYILSKNYWANELAITALTYFLKINIIPIERYKKIINGTDRVLYKIPYGNFLKNDKPWNKYMFLYYRSDHYELVKFKYFKTSVVQKMGVTKSIKKFPTNVTIFKKDDTDVIPPLYILFLIYSTYYYNIGDSEKSNFIFYPQIMLLLGKIVANVITSKKDAKFIKLFQEYFPSNKNVITGGGSTGGASNGGASNGGGSNGGESNGGGSNGGGSNGGAYQYQYPYNYNQYNYNQYNPNQYNPNQYNPNQYSPNQYNPLGSLVNQNDEGDRSKLAYYITIDMELYPGKTIKPEESSRLKCRQRWNSVRKAYAEFTGIPYVIPPVYDKLIRPRQRQKLQNTQKLQNNTNNSTRKRLP